MIAGGQREANSNQIEFQHRYQKPSDSQSPICYDSGLVLVGLLVQHITETYVFNGVREVRDFDTNRIS